MIYNQATFLQSAAALKQLPADNGIEVAFVGRSNSGKSSAINVITGQKNLARTSRTPGRTQLINLFELDSERRMVDLPGYGYAKVSRTVKERWQKTLALYLEKRQSLRGVVLMMDSRHPLNELDTNMIHWSVAQSLPVHILLTKTDKLSRNQAGQTLQKVRHALREYGDLISVQSFSALKRQGLENVITKLNDWFEIATTN